MRAMAYSRFGPAPDVLALNTLVSTPPADGEVRVKLAYSGVNPSDVKARAGARPGVVKPAFDLITPHSDGAGIITGLGAGVRKERLGERVWIWNGQWARARTCYRPLHASQLFYGLSMVFLRKRITTSTETISAPSGAFGNCEICSCSAGASDKVAVSSQKKCGCSWVFVSK